MLFARIAHHQAWIGAPEGGTAGAERTEQVQGVIARLQAHGIGMEQARLQINEVLRTFSQVEWWGQAEELLSGDGDSARELRDFSRIWLADATPIGAAEAQEFCWALQVDGV